MRPDQKAELIRQGGKFVGDLVKVVISRPRKVTIESAESISSTATAGGQPAGGAQHPPISLPTREETTAVMKRRLAKELYKAELDLSQGLKIVGKPCDCLSEKHTLELEAAAEELIASEPGNSVYQDIISWISENQNKVTRPAIASGQYAQEYPKMASLFKDFRKRVMGTVAPGASGEPPQTITFEEAKKLAAEEAEKEVEARWHSQGQPKTYIIRVEPEPLLPGGKKYVAYYADGTPAYQAEPTELELKARIRKFEPDAIFLKGEGE